MADLNERNRGIQPAQTPASAMSAPDIDVQQMDLDQVMTAVRRKVAQCESQATEGAAGAPLGDAGAPLEHRAAASTAPGSSRAAPDQARAGPKAERAPSALSTDEIMRRVRAEVRRRRSLVDTRQANEMPRAGEEHGNTVDTADRPAGLPLREPAITPLPLKPEYSLHELLQFSDAHFVDTLYRVILRRPADPEGRSHYLSALRNGSASKTEVLGLIRFSVEGRHRGVHIDGLLVRFKLQRWRHLPVLGRWLGLAMAIFRLPRLSARLHTIEGNAARDVQALERFIDMNNAAISSCFVNLDRVTISLRTQFARVEDALTAAVTRIDAVEENVTMQRQQAEEFIETHGREHHDFVDRMNGQQSTVEELREALRAKDDELAARMAEQESVIARLRDESVGGRDKHEADLNLLKQGLGKHESILSDLGRRLGSSRAEAEDRIKFLIGRLDEQLLAVTRLAGEVGAFRGAGEQTQQELTTEVADTRLQMAALQKRLDECGAQLQALNDSLRTQGVESGHHRYEVSNHLGAHDTMIKNLTVEGQRAQHGALEIQRQLIALLDRNMSSAPIPSGAQPATNGGDKVLAPQYVAFEDAFRGDRDDIKQRVAPYLDTLAAASLSPDSGLVLDLGCGRGEWLEVLAEKGYTCRGVDLNSAMVADSRALGLEVMEADAVTYLYDLPSASVAAITAMHIVEHIPHNTLIRLLDQAWRVLIPGGVLILETPNPENLTVGACLFYLDPTHRNPIPPALLQWTVKERGFDDAAIERLTAHRGNQTMVPVSDDIPAAAQINQIIDWFTAASDYAIVAKKPTDDHEGGSESTTNA